MASFRFTVFLPLFVLISTLAFGETTVKLRWDVQANPNLEGKLMLPGSDGLYKESPPPTVKKSEILAEATWTLGNLPPGRTRFYVVNQDRNDEFADWAGYRWLDMVEVTVVQGTLSRRFTPPEGAGAYWYVFDVIGEDDSLIPTMQIMPRNQAVYGHITDAATGMPVRNVDVEVIDRESGNLLGRDRTSASGLYLFFLPDSNYILRARGRDYITLEEPLVSLGVDFPRRRDFNLSRILREDQYRVVVSWDFYPENLDLFWINVSGSPEDLLWEYQGKKPFSSESLLLENRVAGTAPSGALVVEPPAELESAYALAYSQARIRVFRGDRVILYLMPPTVPGRQWQALRFDKGEVTEINGIR